MDSKLRDMLGESLADEVEKKLGACALIADDGRLIPKHRFDCVNVSLREHKAMLAALKRETDELETRLDQAEAAAARAEELETENTVLAELCRAGVRNAMAARALITVSKPDAVRRQIAGLKRTDGYLFYDTSLYMLIPYPSRSKTEGK